MFLALKHAKAKRYEKPSALFVNLQIKQSKTYNYRICDQYTPNNFQFSLFMVNVYDYY